MNYLFFDIECATCKGGRGKICSFGYVLTDKNFEIIKKGDILINPNIEKEQYDWYVLKNVLSYGVSELQGKPTFNKRYGKIQKLLLDENNFLFGFGVGNDLKYLHDECLRYDLPEFDVSVFDVQSYYKEVSGEANKTSLSRLMRVYDIDCSELKEHNSRDDAIMTMLTFKNLFSKTNFNIHELFVNFSDCFVKFTEKQKPRRIKNIQSI